MVTESAGSPRRPTVALFAYGFRPFFLLAGIYAIAPVVTIYFALTSGKWPAGAPAPFVWHGHEMLFGFVAAAVAGFLLTAVPTWTGTRAVSGIPLAALVTVWLAARVASTPWVDASGVPARIFSVAFFPALAITVAVPLVRTGNLRNLPFILLLAILFVGDLAFHAPYFGWSLWPWPDGIRLTINTVMLMIVIVGSRITPAFTRNALVQRQRDARIRNQPAIGIAATVSVVGVLLGDLLAGDSALTGFLAALSAVLLLTRLTGWAGMRTLDMPLLWVLHLGFCWLIAALALKALWLLGGFGWAANWVHAFTTGAFGTMILGVMTRVALGHTGRPLDIPRVIVVAYVLVSGAALIRVFGPAVAQAQYLPVLAASTAAWAAAFLIFLAIYVPILLKPRIDGKPG